MSISDNSKLPKIYFPDRASWRSWLEENHKHSPGIWFIFFKKHTAKPTLSYDESVEEALCYGWIDSLPNKLDEERHLLLFTPRKKGSPWSKLNKQRVARLIESKQMRPAGQAKVDLAKLDGTWEVYDDIENLLIPSDLESSLKSQSGAYENFSKLSDSNKKGILWWLKSAKRAETRAARVDKIVQNAIIGKSPFSSK